MSTMAHCRRQEFASHEYREEESVVESLDGFEYYTRSPVGREFPVYCRRRQRQRREEVLLDQNPEAAGRHFFGVGVVKMDLHRHRLLAYTRDVSGDERYEAVLRDTHLARPAASSSVPATAAMRTTTPPPPPT